MPNNVPDLPDFDKLNFIAGYIFQGCEVPFSVFVQFAREPAGNLAFMMLGLDWQDILKEWLRPARDRSRTPRRHGRKRPRYLFNLDPNEYVGAKPRATADLYPGLKLPGARALFYLSDQADKVAMTGAILEGVTDIGFEGLLGIISMHPERCPGMPFVRRHSPGPFGWLGVHAPSDAIPTGALLNAQLFQADGPFNFTTFTSEFTFGWSATVVPIAPTGVINWRACVWSNQRGLIGEGNAFTVPPDEPFFVEVAADAQPGEMVWACRSCDFGSVNLSNVNAFGFGGGLW